MGYKTKWFDFFECPMVFVDITQPPVDISQPPGWPLKINMMQIGHMGIKLDGLTGLIIQSNL